MPRKLKPPLPKPIMVWAYIHPQTREPSLEWLERSYGQVRKLFSRPAQIERLELCPVDYPTSRKVLKLRVRRLKKAMTELKKFSGHVTPCDLYINQWADATDGFKCTCGFDALLTRLKKQVR